MIPAARLSEITAANLHEEFATVTTTVALTAEISHARPASG
jgi:hypothetical protein